MQQTILFKIYKKIKRCNTTIILVGIILNNFAIKNFR